MSRWLETVLRNALAPPRANEPIPDDEPDEAADARAADAELDAQIGAILIGQLVVRALHSPPAPGKR